MLKFGQCTLDPARHELTRAGQRVSLQPLTLALLQYLLRHPGRALSKNELVDEVWQGRVTSDEAIARAILQVRRAIGDDAQNARHLFTEPGFGYRFELDPMDPAARAAAPPMAVGQAPWRLLPFVNRSDNLGLGWARTGLPLLLSHLIRSAMPQAQVRCEPVPSDPGDEAGELIHRHERAANPQTGAIVCAADFSEGPDGFHLDLVWGTAGQAPAQMHLVGPELAALVQQAARRLAPMPDWQQRLAHSHPAAYARLTEAVAQLHRGSRTEAAARLAQWVSRLPPSIPLQLFHTRLLIDLQLYDEAERLASLALEELSIDPTEGRELQLEALSHAMVSATRQGHPERAQDWVSQAVAQVETLPADSPPPPHLALIWRVTGALHQEKGQLPAATRCLERSIAAALRAGQTDEAVRARSMLTYLHLWQGDADRAAQVARQCLDMAQSGGGTDSVCEALRVMAVLAQARGRVDEAVRWAERCLAQAVGGSAASQHNCYSVLTEALLEQGQLERADQVLRMREARRFSGELGQLGPMEHRAQWLWRSGRLTESAAAYERFIECMGVARWPIWANYALSQLACLQGLLGQVTRGEETLGRLPTVAHPVLVAHARASLAMAGGNRAGAKTQLTDLVAHLAPGMVHAPQALQDLAWLCLEDGEWSEVESLLAHLTRLVDDASGKRWIQRMLQARHSAIAPESWEALRQQCPALLRHCPQLGSPSDLVQRLQGLSHPLPNLLTVLAY